MNINFSQRESSVAVKIKTTVDMNTLHAVHVLRIDRARQYTLFDNSPTRHLIN